MELHVIDSKTDIVAHVYQDSRALIVKLKLNHARVRHVSMVVLVTIYKMAITDACVHHALAEAIVKYK
jgi:hypothetical protein